MKITWKPAHSNNYGVGRAGKPIQYIVLHWIVGTLASADATFANPNRKASAHYGIGKTAIHQYVSEDNTAWHCGNLDFNQRSIGIEHQGGPDLPVDELTYKTSAKLVADIAKRHNIPLTRTHIRGHREISATQCPGTLDIDRIIRDAKAINGGTPQAGGEGNMQYKGYDLTNTESMKVAVDVLVRVQSGEFVDKPLHEDTVRNLNEAIKNKEGEITTLTAEKKTLETQLDEAIKQRDIYEIEASKVGELTADLADCSESRQRYIDDNLEMSRTIERERKAHAEELAHLENDALALLVRKIMTIIKGGGDK